VIQVVVVVMKAGGGGGGGVGSVKIGRNVIKMNGVNKEKGDDLLTDCARHQPARDSQSLHGHRRVT